MAGETPTAGAPQYSVVAEVDTSQITAADAAWAKLSKTIADTTAKIDKSEKSINKAPNWIEGAAKSIEKFEKAQIAAISQSDKFAAKMDLLAERAQNMRNQMMSLSMPLASQFKAIGNQLDSFAKAIEGVNKQLTKNQQLQAAAAAAANGTGLANEAAAKKTKQAADAQNALNKSFHQSEMSAKQMTAAMRQVPMQFTDIIVSLQGGQKPLTVLLQQGGQLKDMFGGIGQAARAMGGYVMSLINPYTILAAALAGVAVAAYTAGKAQEELKQSVATTGHLSGVSANQINMMAEALAGVTGSTNDARQALMAVASSGAATGENLEQMTEAALRLERYGGVALDDTVKRFKTIKEGGVQGAFEVSKEFGFLTEELYKNAKAAEETGGKYASADVLMKGLIAASEKTSKSLQDQAWSWGQLTDGIGKFFKNIPSAIQGVVAPNEAQKLKDLKEELAKYEEFKRTSSKAYQADKQIDFLKSEIKVIEDKLKVESNITKEQKIQNDLVKASDAIEQIRLKNLTKEEQKQRDINTLNLAAQEYEKQSRALVESGAKTEEQHAADINKNLQTRTAILAQINEKYKEKEKATRDSEGKNAIERMRTYNAGLEQQIAQIMKTGGAVEKLTHGEVILNQIREGGMKFANEGERKKLEALAKESTELEKQIRLYGALEETRKTQAKLIDDEFSTVERIREETKALEAKNAAYGKSGIAITEARLKEAEALVVFRQNLDATDNALDETGEHAEALRDKTVMAAKQMAEALRKYLGEQKFEVFKAANQQLEEQRDLLLEQQKILTEEAGLWMLDEETRRTIVEQNKIELALQKEIIKIKKLGLDLDQQQALINDAENNAMLAKANAAQKAIQDSWDKTASNIEKTFRDSFVQLVNGGKKTWAAFTKSIMTSFKTEVADQIYKMFLRPLVVNVIGKFMGMIGGAPTMAMQAAGMAGGGGGMGMLSNASTGYGLMGMGGVAGVGTFGSGLSAGFAGLMGEAGLSGTLSAGTTALTQGNIAGGLGTLAAPLLGLVAAVWALSRISKLTKGEKRWGGQYGVSFEGEAVRNPRRNTYIDANGEKVVYLEGPNRLEKEQEDIIKSTIGMTADGINKFFERVGSKARLTEFVAGIETSGKGRGGVMAGGKLNTGQFFGNIGEGGAWEWDQILPRSGDFAKMTEAFGLRLKQVTLQAFSTATDMPESIKKRFEGIENFSKLTAEETDKLLVEIEKQVQAVELIRKASEDYGLALSNLAGLSFDAYDRLIELSGGIEALQASLTVFIDKYFSAEEKRLMLEKQLTKEFDRLGVKMPQTLQGFRDLVMGIDVSTEEGAKLYAELIKLAGGFYELNKETEKTVEQVDKLREAREATDKAFEALERAIDAERSTWETMLKNAEDAAKRWGDIIEYLTGQINDLYRQVPSTARMQSEQGQAVINAALQGNIPELKQLQEAVSAVRFGQDNAVYTDRFSKQISQLVLAGQLGGIRELAESKKTFEEQQIEFAKWNIERLDKILQNARDQLDALRGNIIATMSVDEAVRAFYKAWDDERMAKAIENSKKPPLVVNVSGYTDSYPNTSGSTGEPFDPNNNPAIGAISRRPTITITGFAKGGDHDGGVMMVGENGPELLNTGRARVFNASQTKDILRPESEAEQETNILLARLLTRMESVEQTIRRWDGDGLPEERGTVPASAMAMTRIGG